VLFEFKMQGFVLWPEMRAKDYSGGNKEINPIPLGEDLPNMHEINL